MNKQYYSVNYYVLITLFISYLASFSITQASESFDELQDNNKSDWEKKVSDINMDSIAIFLDTKSNLYIDTNKINIRQVKPHSYIDVLSILKNDRVALYHYYLNRNKNKARRALKKYAKSNNIIDFKAYKNTPESVEFYKALLNALVISQYLRTPEHKRKKIEDYLKAEDFFIKNKKNLDAIRSKYVLTPHEENFFLFHKLSDPLVKDSSDMKDRPSLNWKVSIKFPMVANRTQESGLFLFFTNTGCFDYKNEDESRPLSKKSLMPGIFYRFDWEYFQNFGKRLIDIGVDNETDLGFYHHSNGGYATNDRSRAVAVIPYINNTFRLKKHDYDPTLLNVYSEHYLFNFKFKVVLGYINDHENEGIGKEWGYIFGQLTMEQAIDIKKDNGIQLLFWTDISLSKASQSISISAQPVINKFRKQLRKRFPLAGYLKLYRGKDEYLLNYKKTDSWLGAGLMFRK